MDNEQWRETAFEPAAPAQSAIPIALPVEEPAGLSEEAQSEQEKPAIRKPKKKVEREPVDTDVLTAVHGALLNLEKTGLSREHIVAIVTDSLELAWGPGHPYLGKGGWAERKAFVRKVLNQLDSTATFITRPKDKNGEN